MASEGAPEPVDLDRWLVHRRIVGPTGTAQLRSTDFTRVAAAAASGAPPRCAATASAILVVARRLQLRIDPFDAPRDILPLLP